MHRGDCCTPIKAIPVSTNQGTGKTVVHLNKGVLLSNEDKGMTDKYIVSDICDAV